MPRDDDEIITKTITKQIVVRDDGGVGSHQAPVHMDPDNDQGPLVIHYDSSANQQGLSVVDETNDDEVFRIEESGLVVATKSLHVDGSVGGTAFDLGDWTRQTSSAQGPTTNTAITRNSATETVHVSNLRVTTKTTDPKTYVSNVLVSDPSGAYAGDGIERGLFFEAGQFEEALRALPPLAVDKAGAYLIAQSSDDERLYRFGFDPDKNENDDGLHFTDTRGSGIRQIQLTLGANDESVAMGTFDGANDFVEICKGTTAIDCHGGDVRTAKVITRQIQADSSTGVQVKTSAGVVQASFDSDGSLMIMDPATNETYFQIGPTLAGGNLIKSETNFANSVSTQSLVTHGLLEPKAGINMHSQNIINVKDMTGRHISAAGGYYSGSVKKNLCFSVEGVDPVTGAASRLWYVDSQGHMSGEGEFHAMSSATGTSGRVGFRTTAPTTSSHCTGLKRTTCPPTLLGAALLPAT